MTRKELKKTADAAEKQAHYMYSQRKREDLYRLISKLADRLNSNYNGNHLQDGKSIHKALLGNGDINTNSDLRKLYEEGQDRNTRTYQIIRYIDSDLRRLVELLNTYELVTEGCQSATPFPSFYREEYGDMVKVLHQYGLLKADLYDYYCKSANS